MIVLSTLNARYIHSSLGLRYLRANLGPYRAESMILEYTIKRPPEEIVEHILSHDPTLVGFGVYIWNTTQTLAVVQLLKARRPDVLVVLGGPEISFETEQQRLSEAADYVFQGEADVTFGEFVKNWREKGVLPAQKIIGPRLPELKRLALPYAEYTDHDIKSRVLYVEASRGCPYKCEYCLSSLDLSVRNFDLDLFLDELEKLLARGARQFKFVDRTFNLAPSVSTRILRFFLERISLGLFLHFEMVPDRLPSELKEIIEQFPPGALQFEIGIQTWSPEVARLVSRRQDFSKVRENLRYLREKTGVHTHADLIVGLPGETWESFAEGFNTLYDLEPDEIQVGLLKRLKGTPIIRHDENFAMHYSSEPPFQILQTKNLSAVEIERLKIFADFWDLIANSGRFPRMRALVTTIRTETGPSPFVLYEEMAQWLFHLFRRTHSIHLDALERAVAQYFDFKNWPREFARAAKKASAASLVPATPARQAQHLLGENHSH